MDTNTLKVTASPFHGKKTLVFGISNTDRRVGVIWSFDSVGREEDWFRYSNDSELDLGGSSESLRTGMRVTT